MSQIPPIPRARTKRETLGFWGRIPTIWKVLTLMAALVGAGASGYGYMTQFATRSDLSSLRARTDELANQLTNLLITEATRSAEVAALKIASTQTQEDVRTLLRYMLRNPRNRGEP